MGQIILPYVASVDTPQTGSTRVYAKTDGLMYSKDGAGVESQMSVSSAATLSVGGLNMSSATGNGIKIGATPAYGWADMLGNVLAKTTGATAPAFAARNGGNCFSYFCSAGNILYFTYHVPHDYALGTDIFWHPHWGHNGSAISGNLVIGISAAYAKPSSDSLGTFTAEITPTLTYATVNIATTPANTNLINDFQLSAAAPSGTQFNSNIFEPDGIITLAANFSTIPTITGSTPASSIYVLTCDIHYQSTNINTINRSYPFYV